MLIELSLFQPNQNVVFFDASLSGLVRDTGVQIGSHLHGICAIAVAAF